MNISGAFFPEHDCPAGSLLCSLPSRLNTFRSSQVPNLHPQALIGFPAAAAM